MNNKEPIQSIFIKQTETRHDPKPYIAYRVDVHANVRQWHLWKRYSDFTKLNEQLTHTFPDQSLPASLPHRRLFPHTIHSTDKIDDRRQALEDYLRAILSSQDDRWRKTDIWTDFLALPTSQNNTMLNWLDEYDQALSLARTIRASINSRDTYLNQQHNVSSAKQHELKAKKDLVALNHQLSLLETGLSNKEEETSVTEGEMRRREDQLESLKSDRDVLAQLLSAARQFQQQTENNELLSHMKKVEPTTFQHKKVAQKNTGTGRAFGAALQKRLEEETRGLDNQQLLEYQNQMMKDQDDQVQQLSSVLARQKELGIAIYDELEHHTDILDSLDNQVDKTATKLGYTNKKLSKIT